MSAIALCDGLTGIVQERARLLVADDDELFCATIADLLGEAGYLIDTVPCSDDAITHLRRQRYALLISDVQMPGNEALQLLRTTREEWPDMPVIVVSGVPDQWSANARADRHVVASLLKPVTAAALLSVVEQALITAVPCASPTQQRPAAPPAV